MLCQPDLWNYGFELSSLFNACLTWSMMDVATNLVRSRTTSVKQMTQLEHTFKSTQFAKNAKPGMKAAARILVELSAYLRTYIFEQLTAGTSNLVARSSNGSNNPNISMVTHPDQWLQDAYAFWWTLLDLCDARTVDEALLEATLSTGVALLCSRKPDARAHIPTGIETLLYGIDDHNGWRSGQTQQQIWVILRPRLPGTAESLQELLQLEAFINEFSSAALRSRLSLDKVAQQCLLLNDIVSDAVRGRGDVSAVITSLRNTLDGLSSNLSAPNWSPHFHEVFAGILSKLHGQREPSKSIPSYPLLLAKLQLLAQTPTSISTCASLPGSLRDAVQAAKIEGNPKSVINPLVRRNLHQDLMSTL